MLTIDVLNLDCLDKEELWVLKEKYRKLYWQTKDNTMFDLHLYCHHKSRAIDYRRAGWIDSALVSEEYCERIYARLPVELKW